MGMAFLSDRDIKQALFRGMIKIDPYVEANIQPASIDLTLDNTFKRILCGPAWGDTTDPRKPLEYQEIGPLTEHEGYILASGDFVLGSTVERIELNGGVLGRLEGKSSLGRIGLTAHVTAGFFDPGFRGHATLELFNASPRAIVLWPGMKICQMSFALLRSYSQKPYGHKDLGSKYQDQARGPQGSEMHKNF